MNWMREPDAEPIPGYRLIEPLGSGGFGEVWKCEAPGGICKAIKFVYGNLNSLDVDAVRAEQEFNALERIKEVRHPFVCSLDRIEVVGGELVIVMELCDQTVHDCFKESQTAGLIGIPRDVLLRYLRDAAEGLDYLNEKHKLQHLDVKPRNLFIVGDRVKVADFGLVKHLERLSGSGMLGGVTPLYSAPETFNGSISERADQYSLAIVYQEMLTGHRPYAGKNVRQMAQQHLQAEPDLRALPEAERPLVARALSKDPAQRFTNCLGFIGALYNARSKVVQPEAKKEPALVGQASRPKSLADTLEDIFLEPPPEEHSSDEQVELGVSPHEPSEHLLEISNLGLTVAQPDKGTLRPTLFIGVGSFGRKALLELRCRFVDRFSELGKIPMFRFLCVDCDPESISTAIKGAPEVAMSRSEVHHLPLQPVTNYRRRIIDQLTDWLPREKLYSMPRSLHPQGSRALGRLAFVDNHQRLLARLRREIQEISKLENIYESVSQTGLALRDSTPRIYIIASAGGGTSGMLIDLGYALRRLLAQMRHPDAEICQFLLCSAPTDPASPSSELANVYATLTEMHHFSDPNISFAAEYGIEGQRLVDQGAPANAVYLLPLPHRAPDALADSVSHLGSYLFQEVTTPLGLHLQSLRAGHKAASYSTDAFTTLYRSLGTYAVWFPRGLLLRLASRLACRKIIETWLASDEAGISAPLPEDNAGFVHDACDRFAADPRLQTHTLMEQIEEATREAGLTDLGATPAEVITGLLATLEEQAMQTVAHDDPGHWARQALNRVRDWIGGVSSLEVQQWRKTKINRALQLAARKVAEQHVATIDQSLTDVMVNPGPRVAAAGQTLDSLEEYCSEQAELQCERMEAAQQKTSQAWQQLDAALTECFTGGGGFRLFASRSNRRLLQLFMEKLAVFARLRLEEEYIAAVEHFFIALRGMIDDQKRDLSFCRQRLRHIKENLDCPMTDPDEEMTATRPGSELTVSKTPIASTEAYWEAIRQSNTARVLLPDNEEELDRAAVKLLRRLSDRDWVNIDTELHERILEPRKGLFAAVMKSGDLSRTLAGPLMEETISLLGHYLPVVDVAQILAGEFGFTFDENNAFDEIPNNPDLAKCTKEYLKRAAPVLFSSNKSSHALLLTPASEAGRGLSSAIHQALPELYQVKVPGQANLLFCRDQGPFTTDDLRQIFENCRTAYDKSALSPVGSAHARFDIIDWMPLDP